MNWSAGKIGTIYQKPAQAIGLSTLPIGCVLNLPGLPGGGNKIYDRSPYGNIGTITGAVWKFNGRIWCLDFDGTDDYVEVGDTSTFKFLHGTLDTTAFQLTIEFWMSLPNPTPGATYGLVATGAGASAEVNFALCYADSGAASRQFSGLIGRGVGGQPVCSFSTSADIYPNDTLWHHIVMTYDQSLASGNALIYIDTTSNALGDKTGNTPSTSNSAYELHIGSLGSEALEMAGKIALLRIIYGRVLSAFGVQNGYQQEKHLFGVV